MEKVNEDYQIDMFQCQRCKDETDTDGWYCNSCISSVEVDFDYLDWKGEEVCPWCYNQLVDLKLKEKKT